MHPTVNVVQYQSEKEIYIVYTFKSRDTNVGMFLEPRDTLLVDPVSALGRNRAALKQAEDADAYTQKVHTRKAWPALLRSTEGQEHV